MLVVTPLVTVTTVVVNGAVVLATRAEVTVVLEVLEVEERVGDVWEPEAVWPEVFWVVWPSLVWALVEGAAFSVVVVGAEFCWVVVVGAWEVCWVVEVERADGDDAGCCEVEDGDVAVVVVVAAVADEA